MLYKEALPAANLRKELIQMEILEVSALIGTGGFALWQGELLPTVMAVGTLAGLAAWHTVHKLKNRKLDQTDLILQTAIVEDGALIEVDPSASEPLSTELVDNNEASVTETLIAIAVGNENPQIIGPRPSSRNRSRRRHLRNSRS